MVVTQPDADSLVTAAPSAVDPLSQAGGGMVRAVALLGTWGGLAVAVVLSLLSDGVYMDDDMTHFLFAFESWDDHCVMLHWWSRPGYNVPVMLVARASWELGGHDPATALLGARLFSAVQTALVAYLAWRIARRLLGHTPAAALAPWLVWAQPLVITLATTTLTETPAMLYVTLAVWLYLRGNRVWACVAISPAFITRLELLAMTPVLAVAVVIDVLRQCDGRLGAALRKPWPWACVVALLWAPLAYVGAAWLIDLPTWASPLGMFSREYSAEYGRGTLVHFVQMWPEAAGLGVLVLALAGAVCLGRRAWLPTALTYGLLVLHTLLFYFGLFATGGYSRFLLPVSGLLAVLAGAGVVAAWRGVRRLPVAVLLIASPVWIVLSISALKHAFAAWPGLLHDPAMAIAAEWIDLALWSALGLGAVTMPLGVWFAAGGESRRRQAGRVAVLVLLLINALHIGVFVRPLRLDRFGTHAMLTRAIRDIEDGPYRDRPTITQHVVAQFLRLAKTQSASGNDRAISYWREAKPGTLFVWETKYCVKPHDPESTKLLKDELARLGTCIIRHSEHGMAAEVYLRNDVKGQPE